MACYTLGFFLIRHEFGNLAKSMLDETKSFFELPLKDKQSKSYENSPSFQGFMKLAIENTSSNIGFREQVVPAVEYGNRNNRKSWPVYQRLKKGGKPMANKVATNS